MVKKQGVCGAGLLRPYYIRPSGAMHLGHRGIKQMFLLFVLIYELLHPGELLRQAPGMALHSEILSIRTLNSL